MASSRDQNWRVFQNGAGDGYALPLSAGETDATLADQGVVTFRQAANQFVRACSARRFLDLFLGDVGLAVGDIVAHSIIEQHCILRDDSDLRAEGLEGHIAHVDVVDSECGRR